MKTFLNIYKVKVVAITPFGGKAINLTLGLDGNGY